ncbi:MAG: hypothetical protein KAX31_04205, partial [Thermoplasmata archaeon]|nr:hypothetical protein [Thermoplasmata archaeon]
MNPLEPVQAFFGYGFLLFFPGFLWTFLNRSMSSKLGIVERIVHTAGISISFLSLALLLANVWLEIRLGFFTVVIFAILIGCMPLVIRLLWDIIHKRGLDRLKKMIKDSLDYLRVLTQALKTIHTTKRNLVLLGILLLGIGFTLLPHVGYPLPIHTDEWHYMAYSNSLIENGDVMLENPYSGTEGVAHWEIGFIIFLSSFKMVSGVSWPFLFYTLPAVIFALCILTAYVIGRRFGWGLHSAFLVALVPSTLRFLGPVFLVPVTLALFLLPWGILLALGHEKRSRYAFLAMLAVFVFLMHPASGIYLFLALLAICLVYVIRKEWRESAMLGCLLLAFLAFAFYLPKTTLYDVNISTLTTSGRFFLPAFEFADFLSYIGYVPVLLLAIGLGVQFRKRETRNLGLISTIIILFLF